jgi:hypothetical protein
MNSKGSTLRHLLAAFGVAAAAMLTAATAYADPVPTLICPICRPVTAPAAVWGSQLSLAYCDGVPYPDAPYWHTIHYGAPMIGHPYWLLSPGLQCVVGGGPVP